MSDLRIGISGWTYAPWRGTFYPAKLPQKQELAYASRKVNSIEINGSFYSLQTPKSYQAWYDATPADFVFSVKGGRFITHMKRLRDVEQPLAVFLASGVLALKEKLGPILWQFPPNFKFEAERFEAFFRLLPRDAESAARMAKKQVSLPRTRVWTKIDENRPLRYAVEVRHESFADAAFVKLLRKHKIALCVADTAGKWPSMEDVTADFMYVRLHGDEQLYVSGYTDEALDRWAKKIDAWRKGREPADAKRVGPAVKSRLKTRDVFVYFDNDVKVRAPVDARGLARRLGVAAPEDMVIGTGGKGEEARKSWPAVKGRSDRKRKTRAGGAGERARSETGSQKPEVMTKPEIRNQNKIRSAKGKIRNRRGYAATAPHSGQRSGVARRS